MTWPSKSFAKARLHPLRKDKKRLLHKRYDEDCGIASTGYRFIEELMSLIDAGMNHSEASRQMGVGLRTVQRWLACGVFPERKHRAFPSIVDAYGPHLEKR